MRTRIAIAALVLIAVVGGVWWLRSRSQTPHWTGFVEGEDRVIRSEVAGRVLEVPFHEGDQVPAGAVVARLDDADVHARHDSRRQELQVAEAEIQRQEQQITLLESTWRQDVSARHAELRQAQAGADLAVRSFQREQGLDDARARRDEAVSGADRGRDMLARTQAEEGSITVARSQLEVLTQQRELIKAQLAELEVTLAKYEIRAPATATVVQTQYIWPGELAQPGTAVVSVLDPLDKYVQVYVPVADVDRFRVGQRVAVELDSDPGRRFPGEVSFVADQANFTPEKIETRSDRMGQVYRAKVRVLEGVERLQPGTEGNVYLDGAGEHGWANR
jgi:multidrug resistance efflux pump